MVKVNKNKIIKKKINIASSFLIILCAIFLIFTPGVKAEEVDYTFPQTMAKTILEGSSDAIMDFFRPDTVAGQAYSMVTDGFMENEALKGIYNGLKIIAAFWIIIIAMSRLFNMLEKGQDPMEGIFKCLAEIGIAGMIMVNLDKIIDLVSSLGKIVISYTTGTEGGEGASLDKINNFLIGITGTPLRDHDGFKFLMLAIVTLIFPWIISVAIGVLARFVTYQIILEIGIRKAFAPLACCDIYQEGLRSPGFRYIKKLFACFIKIAICVVVSILVGELSSAITDPGTPNISSGFEFAFALVTINLTAVGLMFKTTEYANDIVGA